MQNKIFEPTNFNLLTLLDNAYTVPQYQRPYSWKAQEHVFVLLEDISSAYKLYKQNKKETYYTGPFYYNYSHTLEGGKECYEVIDGQQRITTYTLIFMALLCLSKTYKINDYNSQFSSLETSQLWKNNGQVRDRNLRFLSLSSLDKDFCEKMFDKAFDEPKKLKQYIEKYTTASTAEERLKENFLFIYKYYDSFLFTQEGIDSKEPQIFLNFLLNQIQMIGIRTGLSKQKIFEMFESINSKFKRLDEIDLIKTYIFKCIDETEYDSMLSRWSELIKRTDDNLQDYLKTYVRAFIHYYSNEITAKKFSSSLLEEIKFKYSLNTNKEAVYKIMDELEYWLPAYQKLINIDDALAEIKNSEFEAFFRIFSIINYEHPKPLIFKAFCLLQEGKIGPDIVIKTMKFSTLYMLIFKSIMNQDSKSSIKVFSEICDYVRTNQFDLSEVVLKLNESIMNKSITVDSCISVIQNIDLYGKPISFPVLALIQSIDIKSDEDRSKLSPDQVYSISEVDFDKAITYLQQYKKDTFHVDHIMHQSPDSASVFKYRCDKRLFGNEYLKLLEGHDFPSEINGISIVDGMSYQTFKQLTINRLGNLRLVTRHVNLNRKNKRIYLDDNSLFTTYSEMVARGKKLANYFFKCPSLLIK